MPDIIRTKERVYRNDYSSDDERSSSYRRPSGGFTTVQRYRVTPSRQLRVADDDDDDRRSMRSERLEVGTRHHHLEVDRHVERAGQIERPRSALEYREPEREREVKRTVVYERDRAREPLSPRGWERGLERDAPFERDRETEVRVEKRESRREHDDEPVEYERVSRETEYYGRPDPPIPIVVRDPPVEKYEMVRRSEFVDNREVAPPRRQEDDFYFRRDVREVEPRRDEVVRYDRREVRPRDSVSDDDEESVVYERRERRIVRDRSHSPRHKLHIAEGALAGAGAVALIANHKDKSGRGSEHRGRKVAGGALAGALGAEIITRARSHYRDKSRDRSRSRPRSRSSSRGGHTKLKTTLAIATAALAAAAAGKYIANRNERKEEAGRGRSRTRSVSRRRRYSSDDDAAHGIRKHDAKHRAATIAKVGAGGAVVGAIADHIRSKSQGRSKSKLRTGGVAAATGLAAAAIAGIYENRKSKQDAAEAEGSRGRNHSSRSRSSTRSFDYDERAVDPEQGMVEYGTHPVYTQPGAHYDPAAVAAERSRERRSSRSRSRVRDIASGAFATGAAAIGISQYQKRRERKEAERERREAERERRRYEEEASPPEEHYYAQGYDDRYTPSPPHASGGVSYNDPPPQGPPPAGYTHTTQTTHVDGFPPQQPYDPAHHPPYDPAQFPAGPPPPVDPYGYQPREAAREGANVSPITPFAPQPKPPPPRALYNMSDEEARIMTPSTSSGSRTASPSPEQPHNKSVTFAPLSPSSTRTLANSRNRRNSDPSSDRPNAPHRHRRRHRNPSRSPSPTASEGVEVLPDRFDKDGRPLHGHDHVQPRETEMVEKIVHGFGDVIEGRQSWRSLLRGFFEESSDGGGDRRK